IIWRRGAVKEYVPPELRTIIYADSDQEELLDSKVNDTMQKMFGVRFIKRSCDDSVEYQYGATADYKGLFLVRQSMAVGTFLVKTAGLNVGSLYENTKRKRLPKIEFDVEAFLEGYRLLMGDSKGRVYAVTPELRDEIIKLLKKKVECAIRVGSSAPHCYGIKIKD
ncbi:MAG: hypothetical protein AABW87_04130, partial [Nanoarchaeota archaeon]